MTLATPLIGFASRIGRYEHPINGSQALAEAGRNFEANKAALEAVWPRAILCLPEALPELEWLYARDGVLSGRYIDRQWIGGVTVPARAAEKMLGKCVVTGSTAVLLAPTHAQQIRTVLDRMSSRQVLIVVIPNESAAGAALACVDFSADIRAQRLWFAIGPDWISEMSAMLESQEGIAPAAMMIRVPGLNADAVERVLKPCEQLMVRNTRAHSTQLQLIQSSPRTTNRPIRRACVVTASFRLWDDAPPLLAEAVRAAGVEASVVDASSPTQASALKLARTAEACDAIVTANVARSDLPLVAPRGVPWITWVTTSRVPRWDPAAEWDRLIVADAAQAQTATGLGWPESRVFVGQEPVRTRMASRQTLPAIIADLPRVTMPRSVEEMSSQRLVWERVAFEVERNPFIIAPDPVEYMLRVADQIGLARGALPVELFRSELLVPTFMRSLAACLRKEGAAFRIYGSGWEAVPGVAEALAGVVGSGDALSSALTSTSLLIDVWPAEPYHPARRAGRPVFKPWTRDLASTLRELKRGLIMTGKPSTPPVIDLRHIFNSI